MLSGNDLILKLKGLKVIFDFKVTLWHQAPNKETTVNKKCDNYMKQTPSFSFGYVSKYGM